MIKKLLKYDLKDIMLKVLVYFYIVQIALAGITRFLKIWNDIQVVSIIVTILRNATISIIITALVNSIIHPIVNTIKTFYGDDSYLTHTLPAKKKELLASKYLATVITIFTSFIIGLLSLLIMFSGPTLNGFIDVITVSLSAMLDGTPTWLAILALVLIFIAEMLYYIGLGFYAVIRGWSHNRKRAWHGVLTAVIFHLIVSGVLVFFGGLIIIITGGLKALFANVIPISVLKAIVVFAFIAYSAFAVVTYILAKNKFEEGVNVD